MLKPTTQICKECGDEKDLSCFATSGKYRHKKCNSCRGTQAFRAKECARNRAINQLIKWSA